MVNDPIADMLTRIRNANLALHDSVTMPTSRSKREIARILLEEGYIASWKEEAASPQPMLVIELKYGRNRERVIFGLKRVSKPGLRVYSKADSVARVLGGMGIAVLSTNQGLVTDREARERNIGGEVLCHVW